jgi:hypothetical protein
MKVKYAGDSIWVYKSGKIMSFEYNRNIHLFGATTTDAAKPSSVIIHESGRISRYKSNFNYVSFIKFVCRWKVQNCKYEINVAVGDE